MTCFTHEQLWDGAGGLLVTVCTVALALIVSGWCLGLVPRVRPLPCRRPCCRGRRRARRRAPLAVLTGRAHNPDIDGVFAPPPDPDKETP